ncbi:hypothetical protein KI688_011233 [Linnemannia hyalina]|uniref:Uncharacterized protein n=1 Tax=Linnemannia hyalina TaxID=64524 RepID=A0A9P8BU07_9FUNG|nr:hypothetical protein KI688_011233 [Linnemannia hyalina]
MTVLRTMTLRNGKSVAKEGTSGTDDAEAVVEEAMESMSIAQGESSQTVQPSGEVDMEVDDEAENSLRQESPSVGHTRGQSGVLPIITAEYCQEQVNNLGQQLEIHTATKGQLTAMMMMNGGGTPEQSQRMGQLQDTVRSIKAKAKARTVHSAASSSSTPSFPKSSYGGNGTMDDKQIVLLNVMPRYHRKVPDHEMPKVDAKTSGPIRTSVRCFLYEFHTQALANLDVKVQDALTGARKKDTGPAWTWDQCEQTFVDCAMTLHEKTSEVEEFAKMGREKTESFKEYELRLRRLVEVYRVKELPKHTDVTQTLRMSIPSLTLTVMQLSETVNMLLKHVGMAVPDVTSLDFLMNAIPNALGPDECSEWKVFIDASRKARMSKESDGINQGGSQHHRQHQQVKKTVAAQTNAGASSGSNTVSANNNHNSYPNGHQGQYPGNRENMEVICGKNLLCAPYEVIDQPHAITIGMDLFHRYGFNIIGLPDLVESPDRVHMPVEDEKPTLIPLMTPPVETTREYIEEKKSFMECVKELLEENARIPSTSFCPIPEMKVFLPEAIHVRLHQP